MIQSTNNNRSVYEMKLNELETLKIHETEKVMAAQEWQDKAVRAQEEAEESKNQLKSELQRALNVDFDDVNETIELASSNTSVDESRYAREARLTETEKNKQLQQQLVVSKFFFKMGSGWFFVGESGGFEGVFCGILEDFYQDFAIKPFFFQNLGSQRSTI